MTAIARKILSVFLSIALVVTFCPLAAYADPAEEQAPAVETPDSSLVQAAEEPAADEAVVDESAESALAETSEEAPEEVAAKQVVEFVYVESPLLRLGEPENIALALTDEDAVVESATLTLKRGEDDTSVALPADTLADNAMLFVAQPDDAGLYLLETLEYTLEGQTESYVVDFAQLASADAYCFDVVSEQLMEALQAETAEENITPIVLADDGTLEVAESVEEAIEVADEKEVAQQEVPQEPTNPLMDIIGVRDAYADPITTTPERHLIVAIDPGHGGSDSGAVGHGMKEKDLTLSISEYMQAELKKYTGVTTYMTRTSDTYVGLTTRVTRAANRGADVFISVHINYGGGYGAEVWYPNSSSYNYSAHTEGKALSKKIQANLVKLGLKDRGVKTRTSDSYTYPNGSPRDYYSVIRNSRKAGFPGIIIEHGFIDTSDYKYMDSASELKKMGVADAQGVVKHYGLGTDAAAKSKSLVKVWAYVGKLGWERPVYDKKVSGTTGKSLPMSAIAVELTNAADKAGSVRYAVDGGSWVYNGKTAGEKSDYATMEYIQMQLCDGAEKSYDIYYRVHAAGFGWMGWAKNGAKAGSSGFGKELQAYEVVVVKKGAAAPGSTSNAYKQAMVQSNAHMQTYGWVGWTGDGFTSGVVGESKRMEAIQIRLNKAPTSGGIRYKTHVQKYGWRGWSYDGGKNGSTGESKRLEAIQIELTGEMAKQYDIYYRVHSQTYGWMGWAKNGAKAGTSGMSKRLEGLQIVLVKKGGSAPGSTKNAYRSK